MSSLMLVETRLRMAHMRLSSWSQLCVKLQTVTEISEIISVPIASAQVKNKY